MSPEDGGARWLRRPPGAEAADVRLFCFHHAGGAASLYRRWPQLMPASIEPIAVQLPGRAERFREPAIDRMAPLVEALTDVMKPLWDRPFACFGLSMGARVAWALAHHLRERAMPMPIALYLASAAAPGTVEDQLEWEQDLVGYLRSMGGTPPEVLAEPQLLDSLLPVLRADMTLIDAFRFRAATPLDIPIRVFAGMDDVDHSPERMAGWRWETSGRFQLDPRPGGHFPDAAGELRLIQTVADDLLAEHAYRSMGVVDD